MGVLKFNGVGMSAIAACVPPKVVSNKDLKLLMSEEEVEKLVNGIGIEERRMTDENTTASDLCYKAAEKLLVDNEINRNSVDMILFLSQAADYVTPPTSCILQHRLGLPESCAAIDLTMACSGFIYALSTAFAYFSSPSINRILVCVGETMTKLTNPRDMVNYPLYGDAGTACLIERGNFSESTFLLTSDGAGEKSVYVPCRGFRNPLTVESLEYKEDERGNFRRGIDITMDGIDTFNHAIRVIPKQVKELMAEVNITQDDVDYFVSHQANKLMIDFIVKRLKFDTSKVPFCLGKFGNTSSASIPLTIVSELCGQTEGRKRMLMSGIGAGWSYATCYLDTIDLKSLTINRRLMLAEFKFHHIGIAVRDIDKSAQIYHGGGYSCSEVTYDPIQNIEICFLTKEGMPMIELLAPHDEKSPVNNILQKVGSGSYHCCYVVENIEDAIEKLKKQRYKPISNPVEAVAIENHRVCFLYNREIGLIELVEIKE